MGGLDVFRNHPHVFDHCHEIRVPFPAGDDVEMQVVFHACAGYVTQVEPYIEAVRFHDLFQNLNGL